MINFNGEFPFALRSPFFWGRLEALLRRKSTVSKAGIHVGLFGPAPPLDARLRGHDNASFADKTFKELTRQDTR